MAKTDNLTAERLRELLHYDSETGVFARRVQRGGQHSGSVAGTVFRHKNRRTTYIRINIDGVLHLAHRLAWLYVNGERVAEIDHLDGDGTNNRLSNLRQASRSENGANVAMYRNNVCGFKGVSAHGRGWRAEIMKGLKKIYLGTFDTPEKAHAAYCAAAERLFGEFANFG